jgi:ABC-type branched-subunit amino acid transport system substrate-binding protein
MVEPADSSPTPWSDRNAPSLVARPLDRRQVGGSLVAAFGLMALAGCGAGNSGLDPLGAAQTPAQQPQPDGAASGMVLGNGPVKVGLILPLTQNNQPSPLGQGLRNAAEMAFTEFQSPNLQVLIKDDQGTGEGAQRAAQEAIAQGAELLIGPLFSPAVAGAGQVARGANRPMIAFSTDTSVASRGVYLLSFAPQADVERIIGFAASRGKRSFAALISETAYGNVVASAFQNAVAQVGGRITSLERYTNATSLQQAAQRIGGNLGASDSLFLPEDANSIGAAMRALSAAGVTGQRVQILGTGVWNDARVFRTPGLDGAWFPAPDQRGFPAFAQRYKGRFNADPSLLAPNAYDAIALAAALVQTQGANRFTEATLTNPSGFSGQYGVFRFRADGSVDRALTIQQIGGGTAREIAPAPRTFTSAT